MVSLCSVLKCLDRRHFNLVFVYLEAEQFMIWILNNFIITGFAFIYMEDERDAEDAIRKLDRIEFGRKGRRLRVEWTKVCRSFMSAIFSQNRR